MDAIRGNLTAGGAPPPVNIGGDTEARMAPPPGTGTAPKQQIGAPAQGGKQSFADVWNKIQTDMGAKPDKPRQIKKTLDKDDFLKIMITQMKHQDPTKPFEADKLGQEIAQIASIEQLGNVSAALKKMSNQNKPLERLTMTNLIGKTVTIDQNRFPHTKGNNETLNFNLPSEAKDVKLALVSKTGEVVMEKSLGAKPAGHQSFVWDGKKSNTLDADNGDYILRIEAVGKDDKALHTSTLSKAKIIGVAVDGEDPVFIVGDANNNVRVKLDNVTQIEEAGNMGNLLRPAAAPLEAIEAENPFAPVTPKGGTGSNFIKFEPGKGSETIDAGAVPQDAAKALASYQAQAAQVEKARRLAEADAASAPSADKGFPNGLGDFNQKTDNIKQ